MRIQKGAPGCSPLDDLDADVRRREFAPPAPPLDVAGIMPTAGADVVRFPAGWQGDWHRPPRRQPMVFLRSMIEAEPGDGETRGFGPDSAVRAEDVRGQGHRSRVGEEESVLAVVVHFPQ